MINYEDLYNELRARLTALVAEMEDVERLVRQRGQELLGTHSMERRHWIDKLAALLREPPCRLEVDSPSYPPTHDERRQCGCPMCLRDLGDKNNE